MADAPAAAPAATPQTVTLSAADLAVYQRGLDLLRKLEGNPEAKPLLESAIKKVMPEVTTEEERVAAQVKPHVAPLEEKIDKVLARFQKADEEAETAAGARVEQDLEAAFGRLRKAGYTDDGLEKIKGLMVDRKIADPEAAAALFDKLNPAPVAAETYTPQTWDLTTAHAGSLGDTKLLFENPDAWSEKAIPEILNEMRSGR